MTDKLREYGGWLIDLMTEYGWWVFGASIFMFVISLFVIRLLIIAIPSDYFLHRSSYREKLKKQHPAIKISLIILKNVFGAILVILGLIMSLPGVVGQGLLTLLLGLTLMNFPGKQKLVLKIVSYPTIHGVMNSVRQKAGKPPIQLTSDDETRIQ
ncbi:MAG TPA: hypothetical protein VFF29_06475 [Bacteroidota bacterium]|nr:hypothetical protein [Bacteroidota bacterium]